jgi:hypothetical protein
VLSSWDSVSVVLLLVRTLLNRLVGALSLTQWWRYRVRSLFRNRGLIGHREAIPQIRRSAHIHTMKNRSKPHNIQRCSWNIVVSTLGLVSWHA